MLFRAGYMLKLSWNKFYKVRLNWKKKKQEVVAVLQHHGNTKIHPSSSSEGANETEHLWITHVSSAALHIHLIQLFHRSCRRLPSSQQTPAYTWNPHTTLRLCVVLVAQSHVGLSLTITVCISVCKSTDLFLYTFISHIWQLNMLSTNWQTKTFSQ